MKAQTVTPTQHTAIRACVPCPECDFPGPHQPLDDQWIECGRTPQRIGTRTWLGGCGAMWRTSFQDVTLPNDPVIERIIDVIDAHSIAVVDTPQGEVLVWEQALALAKGIAADPTLAALIREQPTAGAA